MPDLSAPEINALQDLFTGLSASLALALSEQFGQEVALEAPDVQLTPIQELLSETDSALYTVFSLIQPTATEGVFSIPALGAHILSAVLAGETDIDPDATLPLTEAQTTRLGTAMLGLARGFALALTNESGETWEMDSATTSYGALALPPIFAMNGESVRVRLGLTIPGVCESELAFLLTPEAARALAAHLLASEELEAGNDSSGVLSEDDLAAMLNDIGAQPGQSVPAMPAASGGMMPSSPPFANFPSSGQGGGNLMPRGLELILDIPLDVTVELGRVRMLIKDVLELSSGSIVELDRVAGEPVDLLVNGRLVAKGEVVVIEDNFGIRITEIVSPVDRVAGLGKGR